MRENANRSSAVETMPHAPSPNAGGRLHCPSGSSHTTSPSGFATYAVASRSVSDVQSAVFRILSGSNSRVRSTSPNGWPVARASRTPSTDAPVLYIHRSPGWASSGSDPRPAIHVSGSGCTSGRPGPIVDSLSSSLAATTGHGLLPPNISGTIPNPNVNVSRSRVVIERSAGTVSSSGPSIRFNTRRPASSGSRRSTGSSSPTSPSSITASVAAAVIGLVVEAIRNSESRCTGAPPTVRLPNASTYTSCPDATSTTKPGTRESPT